MPPALVFIDGDRADETVAADIRGARKIGARVICGHDYDGDRFSGIVRAVDEGGGAVRRVGTLKVRTGPQDGRAAAESPT
jgi:hypothetical protein